MSRGRSTGKADASRDHGSALVMVLVLVVVGSMIAVPLLSYASTMMKANRVLSDKSQRTDAIRGGLRAALADPQALYNHCQAGAAEIPVAGDPDTGDPFAPLYSAPVTVNGVQVTTTCRWIGGASAVLDDHLRYGLVATRAGATINPALHGEKYQAATDPTAWIPLTVPSGADESVGDIWLPKLPAFPVLVRDVAPAPVNGYTVNGTCTVFFPGWYKNDLIVDGPTFFASGIYYFEGTVSVVAGADVTVGDGRIPGCTTSQEAVFTATPDVTEHNVTGFGAAWLFGKRGRLAIDNTGGALRFEFNRRYVDNDDVASDPSLYLSIATVNGALAGTTITDLQAVEGGVTQLHVPRSQVVGDNSPLSHSMSPSTLTRTPTPPTWTSPSAVTTHAWRTGTSSTGTVYLTWKEPTLTDWGGRPITEFRIYAQGGTTPLTGGTVSATDANARLLDLNQPPADRASWRYKATLTNVPVSTTKLEMTVVTDVGESPRITVPGSGNLSFATVSSPTAPSALAAPTAPTDRFANGFRVTIPATPGGTPGTSPIKQYRVDAYKNGSTTSAGNCTVDPRSVSGPWTCIISGLSGVGTDNFRFRVRATNESGQGSQSSLSGNVQLGTGAAPANAVPPTPPAMLTAAQVPMPVPAPVVDIKLPNNAPGTAVRIPGYVAVPQGTFAVDNPHAFGLEIIGGVLAAELNVNDGRVGSQTCVDAGAVDCIDLGFEAEATQSKLRLVSRSNAGGETSIAIIQINENGAYAVNSWEVQ